MKELKIYIASSWKNQHGVEMLTQLLRDAGHTVLSFIENNFGECNINRDTHNRKPGLPFEEWVQTYEALKAFKFDTEGASTADLVIYYAPSGKDAGAEVGIAWASGVPIIGLDAKGEDFGLMRKLVNEWFVDYKALLKYLSDFTKDEDSWERFKDANKRFRYRCMNEDGKTIILAKEDIK